MDKIFIKPASDKVKVRDPRSGIALKAEGESKPNDVYWQRRLKDKDVVETTPPAPKTPAVK